MRRIALVVLVLSLGCSATTRHRAACAHCFCPDLGMHRAPLQPVACDTIGYGDACCDVRMFF